MRKTILKIIVIFMTLTCLLVPRNSVQAQQPDVPMFKHVWSIDEKPITLFLDDTRILFSTEGEPGLWIAPYSPKDGEVDKPFFGGGIGPTKPTACYVKMPFGLVQMDDQNATIVFTDVNGSHLRTTIVNGNYSDCVTAETLGESHIVAMMQNRFGIIQMNPVPTGEERIKMFGWPRGMVFTDFTTVGMTAVFAAERNLLAVSLADKSKPETIAQITDRGGLLWAITSVMAVDNKIVWGARDNEIFLIDISDNSWRFGFNSEAPVLDMRRTGNIAVFTTSAGIEFRQLNGDLMGRLIGEGFEHAQLRNNSTLVTAGRTRGVEVWDISYIERATLTKRLFLPLARQ